MKWTFIEHSLCFALKSVTNEWEYVNRGNSSSNFGSQYFPETVSEQVQDMVISSNEIDKIEEQENQDYYTAPAAPDPNVDALVVKFIDTLFIKKVDKSTEEKLPVFNPISHEPPDSTANPEVQRIQPIFLLAITISFDK